MIGVVLWGHFEINRFGLSCLLYVRAAVVAVVAVGSAACAAVFVVVASGPEHRLVRPVL